MLRRQSIRSLTALWLCLFSTSIIAFYLYGPTSNRHYGRLPKHAHRSKTLQQASKDTKQPEISEIEIHPKPIIYGRKTKISKNPEFDSKLAVIEVLWERQNIKDYKTAISSVKCYALMYGHFFYLIELEDYNSVCGHHKDFYYRRHCAVATVLEQTNHSWYVFLDSDMDVINEKKTFFDFIDTNFDVILYDRFWNWEIVAGSYIVKGSEFGKQFVRGFADFEFKHPQIELHGTDNGAIQAYVAEIVLNNRDETSNCWEIWNNASSWDDIFDQEWCFRKALGSQNDFKKLKIIKKGRAWARDGDETDGFWNEELDFIFHARKENERLQWNGTLNGYWYDTRTETIDLTLCQEGTVVWNKHPELIVNKTEIARLLQKSASKVKDSLTTLSSTLNKTESMQEDFVKYKDVVDRFTVFHD